MQTDSTSYEEAKEIILNTILSKKELNSIDRSFATNELEAYFTRDKSARKYLLSEKINQRNKEFKRIVKEVRATLRRAHSLFDTGSRNEDYLRFAEQLKNIKNYDQLTEISKEVLNSHISSSERYENYKLLYTWLNSKINFNSILDLGCGLHPFSIIFLEKKQLTKLEYLAFDINSKEKELLNLFFEKLSGLTSGFKGLSDVLNLRDKDSIEKLAKLKKIDLTFMLKLTDHLDRGQGHKRTEEVITAINSKFILLSFPTVTRSGNPMRFPKRKWFEYLCQRLNFDFEIFQTKNELFYLVKKE